MRRPSGALLESVTDHSRCYSHDYNDSRERKYAENLWTQREVSDSVGQVTVDGGLWALQELVVAAWMTKYWQGTCSCNHLAHILETALCPSRYRTSWRGRAETGNLEGQGSNESTVRHSPDYHSRQREHKYLNGPSI